MQICEEAMSSTMWEKTFFSMGITRLGNNSTFDHKVFFTMGNSLVIPAETMLTRSCSRRGELEFYWEEQCLGRRASWHIGPGLDLNIDGHIYAGGMPDINSWKSIFFLTIAPVSIQQVQGLSWLPSLLFADSRNQTKFYHWINTLLVNAP